MEMKTDMASERANAEFKLRSRWTFVCTPQGNIGMITQSPEICNTNVNIIMVIN